MDPVRKLVLDRSRELDRSFAELSRAIGRNGTYVQQFLTKGSPARLPERERAALARELHVDENLLRPEYYANMTLGHAPPIPNAVVGRPVDIVQTVPLYGSAVCGNDGRFVLNGNKIRDILAPPDFAGIRDAYAVTAVGESMEPRFFAGEIVYVNPRAPVRRGDFVVVQIHGDEGEPPDAYIKRFVSFDDRRLRLHQYNPDKTLEFPRAAVVSVHRIIIPGL